MSTRRDMVKLPTTLLLTFENTEPLPVEAITKVLDAFSRDYRQTYRRDLFVDDVRTGSIIVSLVDFASSSNELIEFGVHIAELTAAAVAGFVYLRGRRRKGMKTVSALVELASKTGTETRITYTAPDGERLLVQMTPAKAHLIEEHAAAEPAPDRLTLSAPEGVEAALEDFAKTAVVRRLETGTGNEENDGLFALIRELIQALRRTPRGRGTIERIKARLRRDGFESAARILDE